MSKPFQLLVLVALLASLAVLVGLLRGGGDDPVPRGPAPIGGPAALPEPGSDPHASPTRGEEQLSVTVDVEVRGRILFLDVDGVLARLMRGTERIDVGASLLEAGPPDDHRRGRHLVRFDLADGSGCCRDVVLRDDSTAELGYGPRRVIGGRVIDDQEAVVPGAVVWAGEIATDGSLRTVVADEEGRFECEVPAGEGVPLVVRADGFASVQQRIEVGLEGVRALTIRMARASRVELVLAATLSDPDLARFWVGAAQVDTGAIEYPTCLAALQGRDRFDVAGRAVLDDLPTDCRFVIGVTHPRALPGEAVTVTTGRRAQRPVVLTMVPARLARGRVLDSGRRPVPRARVRIAGAPAVSTDATGGFAIAWDGQPTTRIEVRPAWGPGLAVDAGGLEQQPDIVLPPAELSGEGDAVLGLSAPPGIERWRARRSGGAWRDVAPGTRFEIGLDAPAVVDLAFTMFRGEHGPATVKTVTGVVVAGHSALAVPD